MGNKGTTKIITPVLFVIVVSGISFYIYKTQNTFKNDLLGLVPSKEVLLGDVEERAQEINKDVSSSVAGLSTVVINDTKKLASMTKAKIAQEENTEFYKEVGDAYFEKGDFELAAENYKKTIEQKESIVGYCSLAESQKLNGQQNEAEHSMTKALELIKK